MVRHNNQVPNAHFHKKWQFYVKTWFNQPARKLRRRKTRAEKAKAVFPRPAAGVLKPVVRGQTVKYNSKQRLGRGFTLAELKEAGIPVKFAPTIGIAVDHRRKNRSLESLQSNVQRLKAYRSNVVIFPRNVKKPKAFEASADAIKTADQKKGAILPITAEKPALELVKVTKDMKDVKAYGKLRVERMNARVQGMRLKKAKEAAKEAEANN
uniref:60S ribosomal protein L13 n=1 Tax=Chlamydomonas leiostraca TaxID=1034604 RepID=A0A7S0WUN4_9CHLO